ncbi:MAG: hypothetical protein KGY81_02460 [Phycisphaerae bacterium]|nr:hypothetical protein [Phycisphaerae bacterium]
MAETAAQPDGQPAGPDGDVIEKAAIAECIELYVEPNAAMTDSTKVRRYDLMLAKGKKLLAAHRGARNLHEVRGMMMRAAQARAVVAGTADARQAMFEIAREIAASEAPVAARMPADLLLTHAEIARHGRRSDEAVAAVARFADTYRGTEVEADSAMHALMMTFEIGHKTLYKALEHRLIREFRDDPHVVAFLRDRFGKRIDHTLVNARLERPDSKGFWRLPMDILGRPVTVAFWSAAVDDLELKMRLVKRVCRENPDDVFLLGVNVDPAEDMASDAAKRLGLDFPQVYRGRGAADPFFLMFSNATIPSVSYIRPDGRSASVIGEMGRDDLGWNAPADREPSALALTFLRSGEFLVTRPVGGTDPSAPPELGTPQEAREAMAELKGTRLPAGTLQSIQACFTVPPRRYRLGKPITGRYDRPDREPAADLYEEAIEQCERAITEHPDAADLFLVRNRLMVALVGLGIIRTDPSLTQRAAGVGRVVLENKDIPQTAKLQADVCALRWTLRKRMDTAAIRDALRAFVERYAGGHREPHAVAMAAMLALELGDGKLHKDLVHEIERHHRLNQDMRPFLWHFVDDRETGRDLRAEVSLLDGGTLTLPRDWRGRAGVVIFITYCDDPEVMKQRCDHMRPFGLKRHWKMDSDRADSLNVLYAIVGGTRRQVRELAEEREWSWPVAHSGPGWDVPLAQAYRGPGTIHGYAMLVVDSNGRIIDDKRGLWMNRHFHRTLETLRRRRADSEALAAGRAALGEGNYRKAAAAFQGIVDRTGDRRPTPRTCMWLARARAGLGQWEQAGDWIDRAQRFAVDAEAGRDLLDEIESLREQIGRDSEMSDEPPNEGEFVQPDVFEEIMPGSRVIPRWNVVGPFRMIQTDADNHYLSLVTDVESGVEKAWARPLLPEQSPDLEKTYKDRFGGKAQWRQQGLDEKGFLPLSRPYDMDYAIACALTYIHSPKGGEYEVGIGSDDHHVVRVNGRSIHQHYGPRAAEPAQNRFTIRLEPGWNEILVKSGNETGGWGFYFQIVDPQESLRFSTNLPDDARVNRSQTTGRQDATP